MFLCPSLVIFSWISLSAFDGSLFAAWESMVQTGPLLFFYTHAPRPDFNATVGYMAWLLFQVVLYQFLPSKLSSGQLTPAGHLLKYRTNGLLAWAVTHVLFGLSAVFGFMNAAIIARNWESLLVSANVAGFLLSGFAYAKAVVAPTHEGDLKFSGE